jgi:hypothetical protein
MFGWVFYFNLVVPRGFKIFLPQISHSRHLACFCCRRSTVKGRSRNNIFTVTAEL